MLIRDLVAGEYVNPLIAFNTGEGCSHRITVDIDAMSARCRTRFPNSWMPTRADEDRLSTSWSFHLFCCASCDLILHPSQKAVPFT
jgi:hypothetical protein